jgi:hypothetical protein
MPKSRRALLSQLTVPQLRSLAIEVGLTIPKGKSKTGIISILMGHLSASEIQQLFE